MILIDEKNSIIVLTRIYSDCSHNMIYSLKSCKIFSEEYPIKSYEWGSLS